MESELAPLIPEILDFLIDLKIEWKWKKNETRARNSEKYKELEQLIDKLNGMLA